MVLNIFRVIQYFDNLLKVMDFFLKKMLKRSMDFRFRTPQLSPVLVDSIFIQSKAKQSKPSYDCRDT